MLNNAQKLRVLIFIVTYNAEKTITKVLSRIPANIFKDSRYETEILIIDDGSKDQTFSQSINYQQSFNSCPLLILKNPVNLGYGGNQKVGYRYAIDNGFDVVALLHGDGQYAPEELPKLIEPFLVKTSRTDAVFGSRMLKGTNALAGGMPLYKFIGNKILSFLQNKLTGLKLSEWHSGYRLYSCNLLKTVPFELNSNGFDFDTDIIVQIKAYGGKIIELPIPTFYGDEISHVNVIPYGLRILSTCFLYQIQKLSLFYNPKFDLEIDNNQYREKFSFESSHSLALKYIEKEDNCLIVGCGPPDIVRPFVDACKQVTLIDIYVGQELLNLRLKCWQADLDNIDLNELTKSYRFSKVLALDVIEHLKSPESFCRQLRDSISCHKAEVIFTTPNVAFLPIRLMMLLGFFNYGKRGILDRTHTRLFTYSSLKRLLKQGGFEVLEIKGIPAPFPLALGNTALARILLSLNSFFCKIMPGVFSFQLLVKAKILPTASYLLHEAQQHAQTEKANIAKLKN